MPYTMTDSLRISADPTPAEHVDCGQLPVVNLNTVETNGGAAGEEESLVFSGPECFRRWC